MFPVCATVFVAALRRLVALTFDGATGLLASYLDKTTGATTALSQTIGFVCRCSQL